MSALWQMSAVELAAAIRSRQVACREVMDAVLERVEQLDGRTNAFAFVDPDAARQGADAADRLVNSGVPLGPLHGIPVSVKDLISTAGMRTAYGSHAFSGQVPKVDAEAVARVRRAGGVVFGKTTTAELGCKITTDSPLHGTTRNPWNLERTSGGSSGGAAVATAMGFGPLAVTTDGSGSSRIPAACCGVIGLKPTLGAIPMELAADLFGGLSCIGAMARTAADIRLLFEVMSGPCSLDPLTLGKGSSPQLVRREGFDGLRVRWIRNIGDHAVDAEVERLTAAAVAQMAQAGARVVEGPNAFDWALDSCRILIRANQAARYGYLLNDWRDRLDPIAVQCLDEGLNQTREELAAAILERSALFRRVQALFDAADVLIMPTFAATPPLASQRADQPFSVAGAPARPLRTSWYSYGVPFNPTGHPAISVPCGRARDGMPVGLQIVGPWHGEHLLIDLAQAFEPLIGWREQWPDMALPSQAKQGGFA